MLPFREDQAAILETPTGDIPYWFAGLENGYAESYTEGEGNSTTLDIFVKWDDAAEFKYRAMASTTGTAGADRFERIAPLQLKWAPTQYLASLDKVDVNNSDEGGFEIDYDGWPNVPYGFIRYSATFVTRNYSILTDDDLPEEDLESEEEYIPELSRWVRRTNKTIPKERKYPSLQFETDEATPKNIAEVGFFPIYEKEYIYTLLMVPEDMVPQAAIDARLITLNNYKFDGKEAETMLFKGLVGEMNPYIGSDGARYVDLPYLFGYRPNGWNKVPFGMNTDGGPRYVSVRQKGAASGTKRPYAKSTFAELFRPRAT